MGGAQQFVLGLASKLKELGHSVEVAFGNGKYLEKTLSEKNIPYQFLGSLQRNASLITAIKFIYEFYLTIKDGEYDIIHLNSTNALLAAIPSLFVNSKTVFTVHGLSLVDKNSRVNPLYQFIFKIYYWIFFKFIDRNIFVSRVNYEEAIAANLIKSADIIYNGLDIQHLNYLPQTDAREYLEMNYHINLKGAFLIGSIGRLAHPKNYDFLIKIFSKIKEQIPEAKAVIIGAGPFYDEYSALIKSNGLQDDFYLVGEISSSYFLLKAFDVFVLPSLFEGLSISLLESLFADIPILAAKVGGNVEIVNWMEDELFELDNSEECIQKLCAIRSNVEKIVAHNHACKPNFTSDKMVGEYVKVYEKLLK